MWFDFFSITKQLSSTICLSILYVNEICFTTDNCESSFLALGSYNLLLYTYRYLVDCTLKVDEYNSSSFIYSYLWYGKVCKNEMIAKHDRAL